MAFSIPPWVSVTLGVGFPGQGTLATPFVTTAPNLFKSTKSLYSIPEPKVPDAVMTGFLNSTPAIVIFVFIKYPPPLHQKRDRQYKFWHCLHVNDDLSLWSCIRIQGMLPRRRPFSLPKKYKQQFPYLPHIL